MDRIREFAPGDTASAVAFMHELEAEYTRVYVEEQDIRGWHLVYGDEIKHAVERLTRLNGLVRFRIRVVRSLQDATRN